MKATQKLHDLGQSIWLDNITRDLLTSGTLKRYIDELSVTGLTSNPSIFHQAIKSSTAYDASIRTKLNEGKSGEKLFFDLAIEDVAQAADLFRPVFERTCGVDGWASLEVSRRCGCGPPTGSCSQLCSPSAWPPPSSYWPSRAPWPSSRPPRSSAEPRSP